MDYSQLLNMRPELSLIAVTVILFMYDLMVGEKGRNNYFQPLACLLLLAHIPQYCSTCCER